MADAAKPYPTELATHNDVAQVLASVNQLAAVLQQLAGVVNALGQKTDRLHDKIDDLKADVGVLRVDVTGVQTNLKWVMSIGGAIGTMMLAVIGGVLLRIVLKQ